MLFERQQGAKPEDTFETYRFQSRAVSHREDFPVLLARTRVHCRR